MWQSFQSEARRLGVAAVAAVPVTPAHVAKLRYHLDTWLSEGRHGDMAWMARGPDRRADPRQVLENARTVITCTLNYYTEHFHSTDPRRGRISRYAWGDDYHEVMLPKLRRLAEFLRTLEPSAESLCYVDTGPIMEKTWAARAGLGWQGKHTNLIDPKRGSWFFVGEILTTAVIARSETTKQSSELNGIATPREAGLAMTNCGTCTRCIDVCPTCAITAPYQLDPRRCISYLTIEHKGSIPVEMRPLLGNHIYGCDLCQDVCPWNRFAMATPEPAFQPRAGNLNPELIPLLYMTDDDFRARFKNSPIKRIKRARFLRNVAVALGNSGDSAAIPALRHALNDVEPLIREHAEWAICTILNR